MRIPHLLKRGQLERTRDGLARLSTRWPRRNDPNRTDTDRRRTSPNPADDRLLAKSETDAATPPGWVAVPPDVGLAAQPSFYFRHH
jgi:hypothetical protein